VKELRNQTRSTAEQHEDSQKSHQGLRLSILLVIGILVLVTAVASVSRGKSKTAGHQIQAFAKGEWQAPLDFQFIGEGWIVGGVGKTLVISGVSIQTDEGIQILGKLHAGDAVILSGRILRPGVWLADRIEQANVQEALFTFNGLLEAIEEGTWRIGGMDLVVNEATELVGSLAVQDPVLVTFTPLIDGTRLALKIEPFDAPWVEPTPLPTFTPTPAVTPAPAEVEANPPETKPEPKTKPPAPPAHEDKKPKDQGRVTICHNPDKKGGRTMNVKAQSLDSHLRHGDRQGPCR